MKRALDLVEKLLGVVCVLSLATIVAAVTWQVLARYVTQVSTAWAPELAQVAFVWLSMLAVAIGVRHSRHLLIDIWFSIDNLIFQKIITTASTFIVVTVSLTLAYFGWQMLEVTMRSEMPGLGIPSGWISLAIPVGFILSAIFALEIWWHRIRGDHHGHQDFSARATV